MKMGDDYSSGGSNSYEGGSSKDERDDNKNSFVHGDYKKQMYDLHKTHQNASIAPMIAFADTYRKHLNNDFQKISKDPDGFIDAIYKELESQASEQFGIKFTKEIDEHTKKDYIGKFFGAPLEKITQSVYKQGENFDHKKFLKIVNDEQSRNYEGKVSSLTQKLGPEHVDDFVEYSGIDKQTPPGYKFKKEALKNRDTLQKVALMHELGAIQGYVDDIDAFVPLDKENYEPKTDEDSKKK